MHRADAERRCAKRVKADAQDTDAAGGPQQELAGQLAGDDIAGCRTRRPSGSIRSNRIAEVQDEFGPAIWKTG